MTIIAKTKIGKEYLYIPRTARKVSKKSAQIICDIVNKYKYLLDTKPDECWHVYEIDEYSPAFDFAQYQSFTMRNGIVTARNR